MIRRPLSLVLLMIALALPLSASQFVDVPFEQVARESELIVRGTVEKLDSRWNDSREIIFTYATIRVHDYFGDTTGPDLIVVREVGGTVDGYTQVAIGFPELREGEDVVLMLGRWDDTADYRIHAYNKGKYLVRMRGGNAMLHRDEVTQGHERARRDGLAPTADARPVENEPALTLEEFEAMVNDARIGEPTPRRDR